MSKFTYLSLSALLVSTAAWPMKFSAPLNKLKLPLVLSTEQPPAVKYVPPGKIAVSALRMCGDYDVEHFSQANTNFEFMPHEQHDIDVVIGYWVVKEGASTLPTESNWVPVAYRKVPIAEKAADLEHVGHFLPFSYNNIDPNANAMGLLEPELFHLNRLSKQSFETSDSYRVFAGVIGCYQPDDASAMIEKTDSNYKYRGTPVQNLSSLEVLKSAVDSVFTQSISDIKQAKKLKIVLNPDVAQRKISKTDEAPTPYLFELGNHGEELGGAFALAKDVLDMEFPDPAADLEAYKSGLSSSLRTQLGAYSGNKIAFCNGLGINSHASDVIYTNLESFPMNLACKNLYTDFANAYQALFEPSSMPDAAAFESAKKNLAKRLYLADAYQTAQVKLNSDSIPRTGCFKRDSSQKLIGRIMASYPLKFAVQNNKWVLQNNENNHLHPESLFALVDFKRYFAEDFLAIWGQVIPSQNATESAVRNHGMLLELGNPSSKPMENSAAPVNINFKIRSVGGSCTVFC